VVLWSILLRAVFLYLFLLCILRLMGKREIGKLSIFDLIVSFMIADISAMAIEQSEQPLINSVAAISVLAVLQIILSIISLKSRRIRHLVDGKPVMIVKNGKIMDEAMAKARYNLDDLLLQLREKNVADISDVEFAILETSGKLSVFPKEEKQFATKEDIRKEASLKPFHMPVPLIVEGKVQDEALKEIGQTRFWLKNEIRKRGYRDFREVFYACLNPEGNLYIDGKDPSPGN
jgi:uncharacterized membrane protein YcaP (DUF421 family)